MSDRRRALGTPLASLLLAAWVLLTANAAFWSRLWHALAPIAAADLLLLGGLGIILLAVLWSLFALPAWPRVARSAWALLLLLAATAAYFMDTYALVIDRAAIQSVFETDLHEAREWASWRMLFYLALAAAPLLMLTRVRLRFAAWPRELAGKLAIVSVAAAAIALGMVLAFQPLSSLARNHRELAHLLNPTGALRAVYGYTRRRFAAPMQRAPVGADAHPGPSWRDAPRPRVLVLVVGESARAQSFGVLGYARATTPRLAASDAIAFSDVHSCGTSTAVSLPCMFSNLGQAAYSDGAGRARETVLDVLAHAGLRAVWIDNNTGSKHIAWQQEERFAAQDAERCNAAGCFDEILVDELRRRLAAGDPPALIVLHQKGSHGPSYFERYPPAFRRFLPTCESNALERCTQAQVVNTYDNTILYTDHVLGEVIDLLRAHQRELDSAMLYVADHGESTGEHGFFLHGAPGFMAPPEQTRVPMLLWLSSGFGAGTGLDRGCVAARAAWPFSHDHLFHSVLGLLDVRTRDYDARLDLAYGCRGGGGGSQWVRAAQRR